MYTCTIDTMCQVVINNDVLLIEQFKYMLSNKNIDLERFFVKGVIYFKGRYMSLDLLKFQFDLVKFV